VTVAKSAAATVEEYLGGLPAERRAVVAAALDLVRRHLPAGYEEAMSYGMIGWQVPLAVHPTTDNKQPLLYAALAAQKRHYALYLMTPPRTGTRSAGCARRSPRRGRRSTWGSRASASGRWTTWCRRRWGRRSPGPRRRRSSPATRRAGAADAAERKVNGAPDTAARAAA
jgi:hypothetical protein